MARYHGQSARVYLEKRDLSADIGQIEAAPTADTHDRTTFGDAGWRTHDPGLIAWEGSFEAFYDDAAGGIGRQVLETLLGTTGAILSIYLGDADAVGDRGWLGSDAILEKAGEPVNVADLVKLSATLRGSGKAGLLGRLLHAKAAETATGNGTSLDNTASSASGGRANLHVTAASGTTPSMTAKIQHSADNITFADLITFTAATAALAETKEATGTVNRYLRATWTITGTTPSFTFVVGFARY